MSSVYTRNRKPTGLEYFDTATQLYIELRRVTGNNDIFPKRSLYTDVIPMIDLYHEMRKYMVKAQTRFPDTPENLAIRKEYIQRAIESGEALMIMVQDCVWVLDKVTPSRMEQVGQLLRTELNLLRAWKSNSKVLRSKN
jgi:hypothetical protein